MFNRMLNAIGIAGAPSASTILDSPYATPGRPITGHVRITGGRADADIGQIVMSLVTQTGTPRQDHDGAQEFFRLAVQQEVRVPAREVVSIPFQLPLPWQTPITTVGGTALPGISIAVQTELFADRAVRKSDPVTLQVGPLPSQNQVLDAFGQLGFSFRRTGIETGHLPSVPHQLGFHQKFEFFPPTHLVDRVNRVGLTFAVNPHELYVILDAGTPGGGDATGRYQLPHDEAQAADWTEDISVWLIQAVKRSPAQHAFLAGNPAFAGSNVHNPAFSGPQPEYGRQPGYDGRGYDHDDDSRRRGPGVGGMLAAGAAGAAGGVLGGMALGGLAEEFFGEDGE